MKKEKNIICMLVKTAKERHGRHDITIFPMHGKTWHQSHAYDSGMHYLYYHLRNDEKSCHCIAMDIDGNIMEED